VHVLDQLASVRSDIGDVEGLTEVVATLRRIAPADSRTHYYSASLYFLQGRPDLAALEAALVVRHEPSHSRAQNLLGASLGSLGQLKSAREAFEAAIRANPLSARTYLNLAVLEMESNNREMAAQRYAEALVLDPTLEDARQGLEKVRVSK
jgi:tetratricopeptide (TPR) repeat protein